MEDLLQEEDNIGKYLHNLKRLKKIWVKSQQRRD